jgi:integrase/recombinase XerD
MNPQVTLSAAIEGYLLYADARRLSVHTIADYTNTIRKFRAFLGGDPPIAGIAAGQVRTFLASLEVSKKTVLNYHTGLSALWTWAVQERLVEQHILRQVDRPDPEKPAINPFTKSDIEVMIKVCNRSRAYTRPGKRECTHARPTALRDKAIILLLVDTGIRASELCKLSTENTDLKNRRVTVQGKGSKERVLPVSARTAQIIWRYLNDRRPTPRCNNNRLFLNKDGMPLTRDALRHLITSLGHRAGVAKAHPHRFRHTFAIQFLRNGGNGYVLQTLLGHSTMEMVRIYLKIARQDVEESHRHASPVDNWGL